MTDPQRISHQAGALGSRVRRAVTTPATDDRFDLDAELRRTLSEFNLTPSSGGGRVAFAGADPVVPSSLRLGAAAAIALAVKSIAVAAIHRDRGGAGQDISVDLRSAPRRLCPFHDQRWELLNGYPGGSPSNPSDAFGLRFYRTRDHRWVMPLNPYPAIKVAAQRMLGVPDDVDAVAAAIVKRDAEELEDDASARGVVLAMVRSTTEFLATAQFRDVLADAPLIEITRIAEAPPEPLDPGVDAPLSGVRVLGMGHVIAGAGAGRALALHGADVLNVWRPDELEHDLAYLSANVGMRSCSVDPHAGPGRSLLRKLLAGADVFVANRRPHYLERLGLGVEEAAALRPGLIHATVSLHGQRGPWADRVGFDQTAGCVSGMMLLEGGGRHPRLPPISVVNDYITAWLLAAGVVSALRRRAAEGGSWRVHISLTRVALWILAMGVFDLEYAARNAGVGAAHAYLEPTVFRADTPLGAYQGVTDQVMMSATPGHYNPVLVPRGSSRPAWLG